MATFFKTSRLWIVEYTWHGAPRRWYRALPVEFDAPSVLSAELADVQGPQAKLVAIRPATHEEETDYLQGNLPPNIVCPTGNRGEEPGYIK